MPYYQYQVILIYNITEIRGVWNLRQRDWFFSSLPRLNCTGPMWGKSNGTQWIDR